MSYFLGSPAHIVATGSHNFSGWRGNGSTSAAGARPEWVNQGTWSPLLRPRPQMNSGDFTRDWSSAVDGVLPMPFTGTVGPSFVYPDPLLFSLALAPVSLSLATLNLSPSPLVFTLSLPSTSVIQGTLLTPSPLVFTLSFPVPAVTQFVTPSPLTFSLVFPSLSMPSQITLSPIVFQLGFPSLVVNPGPISATLDPLTFRLFLPAVQQVWGTPTPGAVLTKTLYYVVLTGTEDSTSDVLLSAQSIQATLRSSGQDVLSVYVPDAATVLPSVLDRLNGQLIVWEKQIYSDGTVLVSEVIRTPITEEIRRDRGPVRDTLTLSGRAPVGNFSSTARTLPSVMQLLSQTGNSSFRVPYDSAIRPLDLVTYSGLTFVAGAIQISLNITTQTMQIQEL